MSNEGQNISKKRFKINNSNSEEIVVSSTNETDDVCTVEKNNIKVKKTKKSKSKVNVSLDSDLTTTKKHDEVIIETVEKKTKKKHKLTDSGKCTEVSNEDNPQEGPRPAVSGATSNKQKKKEKKFLNDDEAQVKEEDIDKFCDDLDDEDNKQYEDWVKLIEANFRSNKKT